MTSEPSIIETSLGKATLRRSDRKTLAISVLPDGSLELIAPLDASDDAILEKVLLRRKWIVTQRRIFQEMNAPRTERRYVTGATHRYLGRQYRLKITQGNARGVLLKGPYFHVTTLTGTPEEVRKTLEKWFREKATTQLSKRVEAWQAWCVKNALPTPRLRLLKMPKRWGSASIDGRLALNPELIHMTSRCIDYVITHEICHLMHPNHGPQFFRLLASLMPDWKNVKQQLECATL